jgi:hypothetical protein
VESAIALIWLVCLATLAENGAKNGAQRPAYPENML